jgi:hypothetical protein
VGCPRMTSDSTASPSSAVSVEKHSPPDGPVELVGSSAATYFVVTLAAPSGSTSEAEDPPPAATCVVAPTTRASNWDLATTDSLITQLGFDGVLGLSNLGCTRNAGPPRRGNLPEDGMLYAREPKLKSQTQYKK